VPAERFERPIPRKAIALAGLSLLLPVVVTFLYPDARQGAGTLVWLAAVIPAFVLSYYWGWLGSAVALASGIVALSATTFAVLSMGVSAPEWDVLWGVVAAYVSVTMGIGWLSDGLNKGRTEAETLAMTDALTGLANRRFAHRLLEQAFALAARGMPLSVVLFDVDHFKDFNDRRGHVAGDEALRTLGNVLNQATRKSDLAVRYGGEEFLCVLNNCRSGGALTFTERVRRQLATTELAEAGLTLSAGVARYEPEMETYEDLVAAADEALYAAKSDGRNCTSVAAPGRPVCDPHVVNLVEQSRRGEGRAATPS
jgi:diguanylate cyclase (GGDEF)-like protein